MNEWLFVSVCQPCDKEWALPPCDSWDWNPWFLGCIYSIFTLCIYSISFVSFQSFVLLLSPSLAWFCSPVPTCCLHSSFVTQRLCIVCSPLSLCWVVPLMLLCSSVLCFHCVPARLCESVSLHLPLRSCVWVHLPNCDTVGNLQLPGTLHFNLYLCIFCACS